MILCVRWYFQVFFNFCYSIVYAVGIFAELLHIISQRKRHAIAEERRGEEKTKNISYLQWICSTYKIYTEELNNCKIGVCEQEQYFKIFIVDTLYRRRPFVFSVYSSDISPLPSFSLLAHTFFLALALKKSAWIWFCFDSSPFLLCGHVVSIPFHSNGHCLQCER